MTKVRNFFCKRCATPIEEFDYYCPRCARNLIGRIDKETIARAWAWADANIAEHRRMDRVMKVPPHIDDFTAAPYPETFVCATSEMDGEIGDD